MVGQSQGSLHLVDLGWETQLEKNILAKSQIHKSEM